MTLSRLEIENTTSGLLRDTNMKEECFQCLKCISEMYKSIENYW